jgi:hypothetical protein
MSQDRSYGVDVDLPARGRRGGLAKLAFVAGCIGVLTAWLVPAVHNARNAARKAQIL